MEAKELRVGNYLLYNDKTITVLEGISKDDISIRHLINNHGVGTYIMPSTVINPIPLTEGWLVKFGFDKTSFTERHSEVHGWSAEFSIDNRKFALLEVNKSSNWGSRKGCYNVLGISYLDVWIKHVHQLQNLYFALTGEELTIK